MIKLALSIFIHLSTGVPISVSFLSIAHAGLYSGTSINELPRDWGNLFVISRVRYIKNLDITNLGKNNQNVRYIEV